MMEVGEHLERSCMDLPHLPIIHGFNPHFHVVCYSRTGAAETVSCSAPWYYVNEHHHPRNLTGFSHFRDIDEEWGGV